MTALLFFFCAMAVAQENDAGLWTSFQLKKDLAKDWRISGEWENRFNENWSELRTSFVDLAMRYEAHKYLDVTLNYRFGNRRTLENQYFTRQRWALDLSTKWEIGKVDFGYRSRFQMNQSNRNERETGIEFSNAWRNKISADFKLMKRTRMAASTELFVSDDESGWFLSDIRTSLGLRYKVKKRNYVSLAYIFQTELQQANPLREYIVRLKYALELK